MGSDGVKMILFAKQSVVCYNKIKKVKALLSKQKNQVCEVVL